MKKWKKKKAIQAIKINNNKSQEKLHYQKILKKIKIKVIDDPIQQAIDYYNRQNPEAKVSFKDSKNLILRLTLNYIRHNCSNYEQIVRQIGTIIYNEINLKQQYNNAIVKKYNFDTKHI